MKYLGSDLTEVKKAIKSDLDYFVERGIERASENNDKELDFESIADEMAESYEEDVQKRTNYYDTVFIACMDSAIADGIIDENTGEDDETYYKYCENVLDELTDLIWGVVEENRKKYESEYADVYESNNDDSNEVAYREYYRDKL